jgi:hypothetical protein
MARLGEQARGVIDFSPAIMLTDARESAYASEDVRQQRGDGRNEKSRFRDNVAAFACVKVRSRGTISRREAEKLPETGSVDREAA